MTKEEALEIIKEEKYYYYGLRALTAENVEQLEKTGELENSVDYCDDFGGYENCPELNGVSTIKIEDCSEESFQKALKLLKKYENFGTVLIGGDMIDSYCVDEGELVICDHVVLGELEE